MAQDLDHDSLDHTPDERIAVSPDPTGPPASSLLVGSLEGEVALVRADSGAIIWRAATGREVGTLAQDGLQAYVALGSQLRLLRSPVRGETRAQALER